MSVVLVGISHHQSPLELRERAALNPERAHELAQLLAGDRGEAVCLSTCNRTELYLADESADEAERKAEAALLALEQELGPSLYRLRDESAALHLFRVAAGLESQIVGEGQVLGQVGDAYRHAADRGREVYTSQCAECHSADLTGQGGRLIGTRFMSDYREDTAISVFNRTKTVLRIAIVPTLSSGYKTPFAAGSRPVYNLARPRAVLVKSSHP